MNNIDKQYQALLQDIIDNGVKKETRNGGTISVFGRQIRHNMSEGFPLLTTKRMPFKTIVTELLWFLRGDTNIKFLVDNNCHIWDGDCYQAYLKNVDLQDIESRKYEDGELTAYTQEEFINKIKTDSEFAKKWGELGPIYGKQWRKWDVPRMEPKGFDFDTAFEKSQKIWESTNGMECGPIFDSFCMSLLRSKNMGISYGYHTQIDQIQNLINDLKTNPDSRRLMVNAWNVGELDQMVLPPCHYGFQVYTRELSHEERYEEHWKKFKDRCTADCYTKEDFDNKGIPTRAISLMWNQRSVDTFLGLPFNIASYGLLLEIIAKEVNMVPDELIGNLGDVHLYSNHVEQAKEQIGRYLTDEERYNIWFDNNYETGMERYFDPNNLPDFENDYYELTPKLTREPYPLPTFDCPALDEIPHTTFDELVFKLQPCDFYMDDYQSHPTIKAPLSN